MNFLTKQNSLELMCACMKMGLSVHIDVERGLYKLPSVACCTFYGWVVTLNGINRELGKGILLDNYMYDKCLTVIVDVMFKLKLCHVVIVGLLNVCENLICSINLSLVPQFDLGYVVKSKRCLLGSWFFFSVKCEGVLTA